jgi:hypothetical protein
MMIQRRRLLERALVKGNVHPIPGREGPEGKKSYSSTLSLISVLDGSGWSTPRPGLVTPFPPGKRPVTPCTEGWVGPRSSMDGCGKSLPHRHAIPVSSSPQRVAISTTVPWRMESFGSLLLLLTLQRTECCKPKL